MNENKSIPSAELEALLKRKAFTLDESRPEAVKKRHQKGKRTARENITDLCDKDTFIEYGSLIIAAQRSRRSKEDLIKNTPTDGLITGIGAINGDKFDDEVAKCMVLSYDYTVLAGTQGIMGHKKTDRMLHMADKLKLPILFYVEGGGGRPGDTDFQGVGGLDVMTFYLWPKLSGKVPRIAIVGGYCFAGNAALAGCADVIIATKQASLGMGGPAMIEGGGLGVFHPKEVGPAATQFKNGVIDILVENEEEATATAKKYLSYFQGKTKEWTCADQSQLRQIMPENRRFAYDVRKVITLLADTDSVLEIRSGYGQAILTSFVRVEGNPLGVLASNPKSMGGAIDSTSADKAARFLQLCSAFNIPVLSLCDTPGIMVGPREEATGTVRHASRLFMAGAHLKVPIFMIVTRRAYGLGSMAMAGGSFHVPFFTISWPTGEFGGMGIEGAVRLGYRKELEAIADEKEREVAFNKMVEEAYEHGKAINTASYLEIDEVIDPMESRKCIMNGILSNPLKSWKKNESQQFIDAW